MITSAKNYSKNNNNNKNWIGRTLGQMVKAKLCTENHTKKHIHAHSQKEKKEKYIYLVGPKVHCVNFEMIRFLFRYSTDARYIKLIVEI